MPTSVPARTNHCNSPSYRVAGYLIITFLATLTCFKPMLAANDPSSNLKGYGIKIFRVESGLYPFVQIYLRSFDQDMQPLVNLNDRNLGLMVAGRVYDPDKRQYTVQSIRHRDESIRTILVIDTSATMKGSPFEETLQAAMRFIQTKRPQDQVAIVALEDSTQGYSLISNFERNPDSLARRLADLEAVNQKTRLYDGVGYAMQIAAGVGSGGTSTSDAEYAASTSVVVFSDGKDEGSAVSRSDLMTRITNLPLPIPIYSMAYTRINHEFLKNLQALSKNSFGKYYHIEEATKDMTRSIEDIQNVLQSDYVVTFRAYLPIDGKKHIVKVGIEYPAGSGRIRYESANFETLEPPTFKKILQAQERLNLVLPSLGQERPYLVNPYTADLLPDTASQW